LEENAMLLKSFILGLLLAAVPAVSFAQSDAERRRGEKACSGDASRLCRKVIDQSDAVVLQCLQTNHKKLSSACRKVLEDNGQL